MNTFPRKGVERLLDHATEIFGSRAEAARWFRTPAVGLGCRPIDLLWTKEGVRQIDVLLRKV